jgi:glycerol-3-phosphate dehydrogenase
MWGRNWRNHIWNRIAHEDWELIIVGGGITGAGILREAARAGVKALLVEAGDFGGGTSSRSSKLVHGGFRYLRSAKLRLTYESVRERETLLDQGRGLINPLGFLLANLQGDKIPGWVFGIGLAIYDLIGLQWGHQHYPPETLRELAPPLTAPNLTGGYRYIDAQTDDARLVLRIMREAVLDGGTALNYCRCAGLLRRSDGAVSGVQLVDTTQDECASALEVEAPVVINATGAWADDLRRRVGRRKRLRQLRGGHLIFNAKRLPLTRAVTFLHPSDSRPVFAFPWEGVTLLGTTDVDHDQPLGREPRVSQHEIEYLLQAGQTAFPALELTAADIQSTFAGVRGVVDTGKADPSKESREHILWNEDGLLTVTGGKLTTFRVMAHDALRSVRRRLPGRRRFPRRQRVIDRPPAESALYAELDPSMRLRLAGRHGADAPSVISTAEEGELTQIGESPSLWAEVRWAAQAEGVVHLEDLLLRRVRLGLMLPGGGLEHLPRLRAIIQPELDWDDQRWETEEADYRRLWHDHYAPPAGT